MVWCFMPQLMPIPSEEAALWRISRTPTPPYNPGIPNPHLAVVCDCKWQPPEECLRRCGQRVPVLRGAQYKQPAGYDQQRQAHEVQQYDGDGQQYEEDGAGDKVRPAKEAVEALVDNRDVVQQVLGQQSDADRLSQAVKQVACWSYIL